MSDNEGKRERGDVVTEGEGQRWTEVLRRRWEEERGDCEGEGRGWLIQWFVFLFY